MADRNPKPTAANAEDFRRHYAALFAAHANSPDPRLENIVASVPREDFVGPGPWTIVRNGRRIVTPSDDPAFIYADVLVALDERRNNGEPFHHAAWLGAVRPGAGEIVTHIGAGTGYYTAILAKLVEPRGEVFAFELDADLAARALKNLESYGNVTLGHADAVKEELPPSDVIYVNAGAVAPPASWLKALRLGGRLIFPWRPSERIGLAVIVTRHRSGLAFLPYMNSWFIPCVGASLPAEASKLPTPTGAKTTRSIWLTSERQPDKTATAIIGDVWFSTDAIPEAKTRRQKTLFQRLP